MARRSLIDAPGTDAEHQGLTTKTLHTSPVSRSRYLHEQGCTSRQRDTRRDIVRIERMTIASSQYELSRILENLQIMRQVCLFQLFAFPPFCKFNK